MRLERCLFKRRELPLNGSLADLAVGLHSAQAGVRGIEATPLER
jgi:hypothetical protein